MNNPLFDAEKAMGAVFGRVLEAEYPASFGDPAGEHRAIRESAGLLNRSYRGKLLFRGSDRADYLNNMLTNDILGLSPGSGCYAAATTDKAKMLGDLRISCLPEYFLADVEAMALEKIHKHLDKYILTSDVTLEDVTEAFGLLSVFGPAASKILAEAFTDVSLPVREYENTEAKDDHGSILLVRNEMTGEEGYDLYFPKERIKKVWSRITQCGQAHGLRPAGLRALDTSRIEAGIPVYGVDMDESHFPMEAGIEKRAISYTKGCYLGQETIARADAHGQMNRRLMGLELTVEQLPPKGTPIIGKTDKNEKEIGSVTSAIFSPVLKKPVAMGYVHRDFMKPGSLVRIQERPATVRELPFYVRKAS